MLFKNKKNKINIVATLPAFIIKYTKFDFGWGSAPDPVGGAHSATANP